MRVTATDLPSVYSLRLRLSPSPEPEPEPTPPPAPDLETAEGPHEASPETATQPEQEAAPSELQKIATLAGRYHI